MNAEEIENATDEEYQKAMIDKVTIFLKELSGHDPLFAMQALLAALANIVIDSAPNADSAKKVLMGMVITTIQGIQRAFDLMEQEDLLEGEEEATHDVPFRMQ